MAFECDGPDYDFDQKGFPGGFSYTNATGLPDAPDPNKTGYGQSFGGVEATTNIGELHATQALSTDWKLSAALLNQIAKRTFHDTITNTFTNSNGAYKTTYRQSGSEANVLSNYAYLNGKLHTGTLTHELALGSVGYRADAYSVPGFRTGSALSLGNASLSDPVSYSDPGWGGTGPRYKSSHTAVQSVMLSDSLNWSEHWASLTTVNDSWMRTHNWSTTGATTSTYAKAGIWSYSNSVLYKPWQDATVYITYANSIQPGDIAPSTAANAYQALEPYRSTEWELGIKNTLATLDWTAALFRIHRSFAYTDAQDNQFKAAGEQHNTGLELSMRGKLSKDLLIFGSATILQTRMADTPSASTAGQRVVGVPRLQLNMLAEYNIPGLVGTVVEGNAHYIGRRAANSENTLWAKAYTIYDLGARYEEKFNSCSMTVRLMIANITNRQYWASLYTGGGWTGSTATSGTVFLGEPRTIKMSMTLSL